MILSLGSNIRRAIFSLFSHGRLSFRHYCFSAGCNDKVSLKSLEDYKSSGAKDVLEQIDIKKIRNFSIIAHIDHGKSTLSDRLLELVGNISAADRKGKPQLLDQLKVERERGITVKAQSAAMLYCQAEEGQSEHYLLNLVDTPGHVDFSYEVTRSLASCEGALLLVDAAQGIQAQTLSTYFKAKELNLTMIPVITKVDLPNAQVDDTMLSVAATFDMDIEDIIATSAKSGEGIDKILPAIIQKIPAPRGAVEGKLRCRIIDSWYDQHRGVICLIQVVDGEIAEGDRIVTCSSLAAQPHRPDGFSVQEAGVLCPHHVRTRRLRTGQVGYLVAGMRSTAQALMGDTLLRAADAALPPTAGAGAAGASPPPPLPGFERPRSMLYASVYPLVTAEYDNLCKAVDRLTLNDSSVSVTREGSTTLGSGLRCGFLGMLHMEVFNQRLQDEFDTPIMTTAPTVPYSVKFKDGSERIIENIAEWPNTDRGVTFTVYEPTVRATIILPTESLGAILELLEERRGEQLNLEYIDEKRVKMVYCLPWQEVVIDLHDQVKNLSAGYASLDYEEGEYREADLVKVEVALNQAPVEALAFVCHRGAAEARGRRVCEKLRDTLDRQQFEVAIQARLGRKVFARETLKAYRKDVLIKSGKTVGGGDVTRKKKLLEKQKRGKKRAKTVGKVQISQVQPLGNYKGRSLSLQKQTLPLLDPTIDHNHHLLMTD